MVIAEQQGRGRGRFDRTWVSPPGLNLYFTVLLRPFPEQLSYMNMAATLAVQRTVSLSSGLPTSVKWPNDVRIGGRKNKRYPHRDRIRRWEARPRAGWNRPQCKSRRRCLPRNLRNRHEPSVCHRPMSLTGTRFSSQPCATWKSGTDGSPEGESLTKQWAESLETIGKHVQLRWRDSTIEGIAESVDDSGNLVVLQCDGSRVRAVAGEVTSQV